MAPKNPLSNRIKRSHFAWTRARSFSSRAKVLAQKYTSFCSRFQFFKRHSCKIGQRKMQELFALFHAFLQHLDPCCWCTPNYACNLKKKKMGCSGQFRATQLVANAKQARRQATSSLPVRMWIIPAHEKNLRKSFMLLGSPQLNPCDSCQKWGVLVMRDDNGAHL